MNPAARRDEGNAKVPVVYMALELSSMTWKVAFGDGARRRRSSSANGSLAVGLLK